MRDRLVLALLLFGFALPGASAQTLSAEQAQQQLALREQSAHPAECSRLRRRIDHISGMQARAHQLENDLWEQRIGEQVSLLRGIQAARCPNDVPVDAAGEAFMEFLKFAAKGAAAYFTFGMAGF